MTFIFEGFETALFNPFKFKGMFEKFVPCLWNNIPISIQHVEEYFPDSYVDSYVYNVRALDDSFLFKMRISRDFNEELLYTYIMIVSRLRIEPLLLAL